MKIRAVIFDIYNTLLEIGPPPADANDGWEFLWEDKLADLARLTLEEFAAAGDRIIAREHATAKAAGIAHPEIYWPAVAGEALPELSHLSGSECDEFLYRHAQLQRTVWLSPGAARVLAEFRKTSVLSGIASNSQPYTLRELDAALSAAGLSRDLFHPELSFYSFQAGFSKPDPHVFRWLTARLLRLGVKPGETLTVGDRLDNDIAPARAQGWQTWHLTPEASANGRTDGNWEQLARLLNL